MRVGMRDLLFLGVVVGGAVAIGAGLIANVGIDASATIGQIGS